MVVGNDHPLYMNPYATHPCDDDDCQDATHNHLPQWQLIGLTLEETNLQVQEQDLQWIREERTKRLIESDWTQLPNSPLSEASKQAWADYRQALRDITQTYQLGQPFSFPAKPE